MVYDGNRRFLNPKLRKWCIPDCCSFASKSTSPTTAIIGAAFSGVTMAIASLTGLFHVPVISYASTSRLLSDRSRFQYFYRTVPSDDLQAQAITDLLYEWKWHFIIILASDNEYGRSGITALKQAIHNHKAQRVCVVVEELFSRKWEKDEMAMDNIFDKMKQEMKARVVVLYAEFPDAVYFFKEAKKRGLKDYLFVASDSWVGSSEVIQDARSVFHSIMGFRPPVFPIPEFNAFFLDRMQRNNSENPWASDFRKSSICSETSTAQCYDDVHHNGYVPYVIDAVFSVAHALHAMLNCDRACEKGKRDFEWRYLSEFIQNVSFEGYSQKNFFFHGKGTPRGKYDVYFVHNGSSTYRKIGIWNGTFSLISNWSNVSEHGISLKLPTSLCNEDCRKGEHRIPKLPFPECCWECAKCSGKSFTNTSDMTSCSDCPKGSWPNDNHSDCRPIQASYLHWSEAWAMVIIFVSSLGTILALFTCAIFIKFRKTAIVRASSEHLSYFLLLGVAMFYITPICYIAKPGKISCSLIPFMFGIGFVLVVGTILLKTNRISRIFNAKLLQTGFVSCLGNYCQLFILGCLLATEIMVTIGWVFGSSGGVFHETIYSMSSEEAWIVCNLTGSEVGFSLWLIYNAGLVIVCTYQAFLVRKVPQNYNESRLIAFNMTTWCITVLVYIPSFMGTTAWYRSVVTSFMLLFLGSLTLACIFVPKVFIILFRPHKNVPMRPSVSSITLGIITPSPIVASSLSEQTMGSRQNSLEANQDASLENDLSGSRVAIDTEALNPLNDSREIGEDCFPTRDVGIQTRVEIENSNAIVNQQENSKKVHQRQISSLGIDQEPIIESLDDFEDQMSPRKKSSGSQSGILRKNVENCNGVSLKRKKTSLVRFQDEVCNFGDKNCNRISLPCEKGESKIHLTNEDNANENTLKGSFASSNETNHANNVTGHGRKRKMSVFSFHGF
ncbi:metabotropic glutamate receptor 2-like isoform X2 [Montipora foliosa]|uniref:metabotropic glutamate receptor 2-like isoform X2 n=1 Tax=Montipora foliosa TaxID=591990 RepID=UPI0035F14199